MPITIFMVCWGLSQPPAGSWSDRVGRRRSLLVGIALAGLGQIGAGLAQDWWQLLAARMVGGIGYGIGFISCSAYVQDRTNLTNRSRGMSMFVWAFSAGTLCGTASGGLLADRLGQQATLLVAAMIMAVAWIAVHSCLLSDRATTLVARVRLSDLWQLLRQSRFAFLALLAGIPPKLVITGVNAFVMPLYLDHLGLGSAAIGRMLMLFNLATIACSELVAPLADRTQQYRTWVIGGGLLSGITLMLSSTTSDLLALSAAVTLLGAANGIGQAPLLAMVPRTAGPALQTLGPGTVMGLFRLLERVGSMIGPLMAGLLIAGCGYASTLVWTGALCLFATLSFWLSERKQPCA